MAYSEEAKALTARCAQDAKNAKKAKSQEHISHRDTEFTGRAKNKKRGINYGDNDHLNWIWKDLIKNQVHLFFNQAFPSNPNAEHWVARYTGL